MTKDELKAFLDLKANQYEDFSFIETDPIQIPHQYSKKEDIEISGFFAAQIAWGNRTMIIRNANRIMEKMDHSPYDFVQNHTEEDLAAFDDFVHRTFNSEDIKYYFKALREIYSNHGGLENVLGAHQDLNEGIHHFKQLFFSFDAPKRSTKHIGDPFKGSAAKRIHMYLRWMVRSNQRGVDFGIWQNTIKPSQLFCPLDVHSGKVARKLGLLSRKQDDFKALKQLQENLIALDSEDPVKYDYALFGLSAFEKF